MIDAIKKRPGATVTLVTSAPCALLWLSWLLTRDANAFNAAATFTGIGALVLVGYVFAERKLDRHRGGES